MNATVQRTIFLAACLGAAAIAAFSLTRTIHANATRLGQPATSAANSWDQKAAAAYLDRRQEWWMAWPRAQRDHDTFCVSCHTAVPYALSRQALHSALAEQASSSSERKLLDSVAKRVRLWKEVAPFYSDADRGAYKTVESRGTESVLNALILASRDAQSGRLSSDTAKAFENMWAEQQTTGNQKGAWRWLRFNNEPWEADDSDYYGATLAAVAIGTAPAKYRGTPEIQNNIKMLREYLNREYPAQTPINRVALVWAAAKMRGSSNRTARKPSFPRFLRNSRPTEAGTCLP